MISRFLQAGIMAAWAAFFLWLFVFNQPALARMLHPRLWWLVLGGAIVLMLFCCVALGRLTSPKPAGPLRWTWPSYLVLLVPLIYFWLMQLARFDSQTFLDRSTPINNTIASVKDSGPTTEQTELANESDLVEASFSQIVLNPQQYTGQKVEVLCQTLSDQQLPNNQLICYRFKINCCAADAMPLFLFVEKQGLRTPANDSWVRIQGILSTHKVNGISVPLIHAEEMHAEKEPSYPFVF
jgi:uncharacterized repeat protein (TIGR03943 family)